MVVKNKIKIWLILSTLFLFLLLTGCRGSSTDETLIMEIADNIEKAIEEKNVDLFMENISYDYSDTDGGTYDNHINNLPEDIISQRELAESLASSVYDNLKVITDVTISDLAVVEEQYASGKIETAFSLKICVFWGSTCISIPGVDAEESVNYNADFIKEEDNWKIISMVEV